MKPHIALLLSVASCCAAATLELKPTPSTVVWGYYSASAKPALKVQSGDTVRIETVWNRDPAILDAASVPVPPATRQIYREVNDKGPGGHILTGPVYVEGAEPGDVLEVRIQKIELAVPYAYNAFRPGGGFLPNDFPYYALEDHPARPRAHGGEVRRPASRSRCVRSSAAWASRRRRRMAASAALRRGFTPAIWITRNWWPGQPCSFPCTRKGALFEVGDGHAGQGNGEVDITALETSLIGTFQFIVRKDMHLNWPRAETPTHYIAMGIHEDLTEATKMAVREAIDFLVTEKHLTRDEAYMLTSSAVDFNITQLVDGNKGVHAMIPKSIFK